MGTGEAGSERSLPMPSYEFLPGGGERPYRLLLRFSFNTGITGQVASIPYAVLHSDGLLIIDPGYRWDLGTMALDTPAMVVASLAHDVLCEMVVAGQLPWSMRDDADRYFRVLLEKYGASKVERGWRWVRWLAVRLFSRVSEHLQKLAGPFKR